MSSVMTPTCALMVTLAASCQMTHGDAVLRPMLSAAKIKCTAVHMEVNVTLKEVDACPPQVCWCQSGNITESPGPSSLAWCPLHRFPTRFFPAEDLALGAEITSH